MKKTDEHPWQSEPDELLEVVRRTHLEDVGGPPPQVPGYSTLREIARGGQSVVYRAAEEATGVDVALKILAPGIFGSSTSELRFDREFVALKTLRHPHVVGGRACGRTADGRRWIAMDLIEGPRLDEWILTRRAAVDDVGRSRAEAIEMFEAIARAVQHAHQRGVLHRDLKPANVRVDARGAPHVLDFGIARLDGTADSSTSLITLSRQFLGTPAYAAPEQVAGRVDEIDVRTDVHALGLLLYELLVGRPPYPTDAGLAATLHAIENTPPPRPSRTAPAIDADLDAIVLCALAKHPADRYQSVDALLGDLERRRQGLPVTAHPAGSFYELRKWIGRNRLLFGFGVALVVLALSFGVTASVLLSKEQETRGAKERLSDFLLGLLLSTNPYRASDPVSSVDALLAGAADRLKVELADDPAEQARLLNVVGIHHRTGARYDEAEAALTEALRIRRALHDGDHGDVAESLTELASLRIFVGGEAEAMLREALAMRRRLHGPEHPAVALSLSRLGQVLADRGDLEEAGPLIEEALRIRREQLGETDAATVSSMHQLSSLRLSAGAFAEARDLQETALRLREETGMPAPGISAGHSVLGLIAHSERDFETAVREFRTSKEIAGGALGPEHEDVALVSIHLAFALAKSGDFEAALEEAEGALTVLRRTLPEGHASLLTVRTDIAAYRTRLGDLDLAETELRRVVDDVTSPPPRLSSALEQLAIARLERQELPAAEELFTFALAQARLPIPPVREAGILGSLGWIAGARGEHETAVRRLGEAADQLDATPNDPARAYFLAQITTQQLALGQEEEARRALETARAALDELPDTAAGRTRDRTVELLREAAARLE